MRSVASQCRADGPADAPVVNVPPSKQKQMEMRQAITDRGGVAVHNVLGGNTVMALCRRRPVDLATLKLVDGMSDTRVADYGADIIKVRVEWGWGPTQVVGLGNPMIAHLS